MTLHVFRGRHATDAECRLPEGYRRRVGWMPQIGDIFPDFTVDTTQGRIRFWDWAEGSWTFLFSHPASHTPVCATEFGKLARLGADFAALGVKVLGLSPSSVEDQAAWHRDIAAAYGAPVWFPAGSDPDGRLLRLFQMHHPAAHEALPIRKSFILDPQMRIRTVFDYPPLVGRSIEETVRVIEALQTSDRTGAQTPADWYEGDPLILNGAVVMGDCPRSRLAEPGTDPIRLMR